ncbi:MFS transporter [Geomicrobium sediminis]|uniref:DHA2 family metal-tetracycline-proton antiporter-like MFS transporter n=1 Tax=Geomicrobium sediminis TaxID=1347788 RepID=A0ABS2PF19_9BACL|nr:MFS transporter [Geomicrobium sediminis]MBM7633418.1 DHA2 family metal-tetracycline-proton antiporter-like MFS transporter [Geomicrobium sediminis]
MTSVPTTKTTEVFAFNERLVLSFWAIGMWLMTMNTTMFNVALPFVILDFQLTSSVATWIVSGYSIVFAISALTFSRLSDYVPIKRLISVGLIILGFSSLLGFFATNFTTLLIARLLQAIGASTLPCLAIVLSSKYIPITRRGNAMAIIAAAAALGFGMGPLVGGFFTEFWGWNYLFLAPFVILFILPVLRRNLPEESIQRVQFDGLGAILVGVAVISTLLVITSGIFVAIIIAIPAFILLWKHVHKTAIPFIQPELLHNRRFLTLTVFPFTSFFMNFATMFSIPILLFELFDQDPLQIGLIMFPGALLAAILTQSSGKFIDRKGPLVVMLLGLLLLSFATIFFALFASFSAYVSLSLLVFMIAGSNILMASANNEISRVLPQTLIGAGMGFSQLVQFIGGAFGVGVTGLILSLQQHGEAAQTFRNLYLLLLIWLLVAMFVFFVYRKARKE